MGFFEVVETVGKVIDGIGVAVIAVGAVLALGATRWEMIRLSVLRNARIGIVGSVITVKDTTVSIRSADSKFEVTKASVVQILDAGTPTES